MMAELLLCLGPLEAEGFVIRRSGIHWLCEDGHLCRPNEVIGFCNISLERAAGQRSARFPMADELELQVAFAPVDQQPRLRCNAMPRSRGD